MAVKRARCFEGDFEGDFEEFLKQMEKEVKEKEQREKQSTWNLCAVAPLKLPSSLRSLPCSPTTSSHSECLSLLTALKEQATMECQDTNSESVSVAALLPDALKLIAEEYAKLVEVVEAQTPTESKKPRTACPEAGIDVCAKERAKREAAEKQCATLQEQVDTMSKTIVELEAQLQTHKSISGYFWSIHQCKLAIRNPWPMGGLSARGK